MSALNVEVVSPAKPVAKVSARSVNLPGAFGYMTILPGHAPLISEVDIGAIVIEKVEAGQVLTYFISGGYVSVEGDNVIVLADVVEMPADINVKRAKEALDRATERLNKHDAAVELARATRAFKRAEVRLAMAEAATTRH